MAPLLFTALGNLLFAAKPRSQSLAIARRHCVPGADAFPTTIHDAFGVRLSMRLTKA